MLVGVAVTWQADANRGYDEARSGLASSAERVQSERDELAGVIAEHEATLATAGAIADAATADVVDPAALETFEGAVQSGDRAGRRGERRTRRRRRPVLPDESGPRPFWPWDVLESRGDLVHDRRAALDTATGLRDLQERFEAAMATWMPRLPALFASTRSAADRLQAENPSARIPDVVAFRSATDAVAARQDVTRESSDALIAYVAAATQLRASNQAELEEKAGPLLDRRLAAEAFARSLSGGILLDFDWAPIVNGYGTGGTVGGARDVVHGPRRIREHHALRLGRRAVAVSALPGARRPRGRARGERAMLRPVRRAERCRERGMGHRVGDQPRIHGRRQRRLDLRPATAGVDRCGGDVRVIGPEATAGMTGRVRP